MKEIYDIDISKDKRINSIIDYFGHDAQTIVAIEELSELQKELCKAYRRELNRANLIEEFSDVIVMLEQIKRIYNISDEEVLDIINSKLERTVKYVNKQK